MTLALIFGTLVYGDTNQVKFEGQGHRSVKVTGKQELSDCWGGRSWLKSRHELKTINKQQPTKNFLAESLPRTIKMLRLRKWSVVDLQ